MKPASILYALALIFVFAAGLTLGHIPFWLSATLFVVSSGCLVFSIKLS